eukprot:gene18053-19862_t
MDLDVDLDSELMNKLNTMGTRDHEDLVAQFQSIVGSQISPGGCAFYLEMANWSGALCAYYDIMNSADHMASMKLIEDYPMKEGQSVTPNTSFLKTWKIKNDGQERWPTQLRLVFTKGHNFANNGVIPVHPIEPGETSELSIPMISPPETGLFAGEWRLANISNNFFGDPLTVTLSVEQEGVLNLTQQMSVLGRENAESQLNDFSNSFNLSARAQPIATPPRGIPTATPFCSPTGYGIFGGSPMQSSSLRATALPTIDESTWSRQIQDISIEDRLSNGDSNCVNDYNRES